MAGVPTFFSSKKCHFALFHGQIQNFLGRVVALFAEWWSGSTSADRQGQNTACKSTTL
jgi:hypothetical protein